MPTPRPDASLPAAAAALALMLVVVVASAAIRLDMAQVPALRPIHRAAASLVAILALWIGWGAWRCRREYPRRALAAAVALALTVFLSILGVLAGQDPPRPAALGNLLGGLALGAAFAWLLGEHGSRLFSRKRVLTPFLATAFGALLALQALTGARLAIFGRVGLPVLPAHALLGLALVAALGWLGLSRIGARSGKLVFGVALAAATAGFTALQYERSAAAALAHAAAAALLVFAAAWALGRRA